MCGFQITAPAQASQREGSNDCIAGSGDVEDLGLVNYGNVYRFGLGFEESHTFAAAGDE
jgi:hypothetical protein